MTYPIDLDAESIFRRLPAAPDLATALARHRALTHALNDVLRERESTATALCDTFAGATTLRAAFSGLLAHLPARTRRGLTLPLLGGVPSEFRELLDQVNSLSPAARAGLRDDPVPADDPEVPAEMLCALLRAAHARLSAVEQQPGPLQSRLVRAQDRAEIFGAVLHCVEPDEVAAIVRNFFIEQPRTAAGWRIHRAANTALLSFLGFQGWAELRALAPLPPGIDLPRSSDA